MPRFDNLSWQFQWTRAPDRATIWSAEPPPVAGRAPVADAAIRRLDNGDGQLAVDDDMNTFKAGVSVHSPTVELDVDLGMFTISSGERRKAHHSTLNSLRGVMAIFVGVMELAGSGCFWNGDGGSG